MYTKETYLERTLKDIKSFSTRKNRASDDQQLLKNDLERIEQLTERAMRIANSSKEEYSYSEVQKINNQELFEGIDNIIKTK